MAGTNLPPIRPPVGPPRRTSPVGRNPTNQHSLAPPHHTHMGRTQLRLRHRTRLRWPHRQRQRRHHRGTVALRRRASSPCIKQGGKTLQVPWQTPINQTFEGLLHGFWPSGWSRSGGLIAQCNSAGSSIRSRASRSLRLRSPRDSAVPSVTDVLLDAWDTKPEDRIRRTSLHPALTR